MNVLNKIFNEYLFKTGNIERYVTSKDKSKMLSDFFNSIVSVKSQGVKIINKRGFFISDEINYVGDVEVRMPKFVIKYIAKTNNCKITNL